MSRVNSLQKVKKKFNKIFCSKKNNHDTYIKNIARFANSAFYYAKGDIKANKMPCYFMVLAFGGKMKDDMNAHYFPSPKYFNNFFTKYGRLLDEVTDVNSSTLCSKRKKYPFYMKSQLCYTCPLRSKIRKQDACHLLHDMVVDYNSYKNDVLKTPLLNPDEKEELKRLTILFKDSVKDKKQILANYIIEVLDYVKAKIQKEVDNEV